MELNLQHYFNEDLIGAELIDFVPVIEDDGEILLGQINLRLEDGRMVVITTVMRGMVPWLRLDIHDGEEWRGMSVKDAYVDEFEEIMAKGFTP